MNEAGGAGANAGREQLLLVGVETERHDVGGEGQSHPHGDDERRTERLTKNEAADENGASRGDDDPFALEAVAEKESEERPDRGRERDYGRVAEGGRDGDPLLDEERWHPIVEAVISNRLKYIKDAHQDHPAANAGKPQVPKAARRRNGLLG